MTTGRGGDDVIAATVTDLPCVEWDNLWDRCDKLSLDEPFSEAH
jgi:hypothetical protein